MTHSDKPVLSLLPLIFYYLFQPGSIISYFPFISLTSTPMLTWSPMEPSVGGVFMIAPFLLILFLMPWVDKREISLRQDIITEINNPTLRTLQHLNLEKFFAWTLLVIGTVILIVNAKIAGYAWRYDTDFCWTLCIAAALSLFQLEAMSPTSSEKRQSLLRVLAITSVIFSFLYQFFSLFALNRYGSLEDISPSHYYAVASWFLFLP